MDKQKRLSDAYSDMKVKHADLKLLARSLSQTNAALMEENADLRAQLQSNSRRKWETKYWELKHELNRLLDAKVAALSPPAGTCTTYALVDPYPGQQQCAAPGCNFPVYPGSDKCRACLFRETEIE